MKAKMDFLLIIIIIQVLIFSSGWMLHAWRSRGRRTSPAKAKRRGTTGSLNLERGGSRS
jgi:hypothetical protein